MQVKVCLRRSLIRKSLCIRQYVALHAHACVRQQGVGQTSLTTSTVSVAQSKLLIHQVTSVGLRVGLQHVVDDCLRSVVPRRNVQGLTAVIVFARYRSWVGRLRSLGAGRIYRTQAQGLDLQRELVKLALYADDHWRCDKEQPGCSLFYSTAMHRGHIAMIGTSSALVWQ